MKKYAESILPGLNVARVLDDGHFGFGNEEDGLVGIPTGIDQFDKITSGINGFSLIAGRSGSGKTSLAAQIATNLLASKDEIQVIFISFELSYDQILGIVLAQKMDIPYKTILTKGAGGFYRKQLESAIATMSDLVIVDGRMVDNSLDEVAKLVRDTGGRQGKYKHRVVIIDSIQDLVTSLGNKDRTSAEADMAKQVDLMWQQLGIDIVAISRTNKGKAGDDYSEVYGSVSLVYKPSEVIVMKSIKNINLDLAERAREAKLRYYPIRCNVIKTRYGDGEGIFYLGWDVINRSFLSIETARAYSVLCDEKETQIDATRRSSIFNEILEELKS